MAQIFLYQPSAFGKYYQQKVTDKLEGQTKEVIELESFDSSISSANRQSQIRKSRELGPTLVPFHISIWEVLQFSLCFKYRGKEHKPFGIIYQKAKKTIRSHFQISNVIRAIRRTDELTKLLLSKRQRKLVPMLQSNVLKPNLRENLDSSSQSSDENTEDKRENGKHMIREHIQRRFLRNIAGLHNSN
ncbi:hypothetical protein FGO68_gene4240 [Halteria grandinella]|uniref:Uncharacterized protein n=1 Tax=Halteria grandinella TaxID=5974 RepID=A0A8J8NRN1_HALGN|nr:hypothetical protein FGO68_gene4240 [Halteria grandinella]